MHLFRSKTESSKHLEISFEFYPAEKSTPRKAEPKNRRINLKPGFRSIPFQSNYPLELNYMQRPKKHAFVHSLLSWNI